MNRLVAAARVPSLRRRLLGVVCAAVLLLWIAAAWFSYSEAQNEAEELIDAKMAQVSRLLLAFTQGGEAQLQSLAPRIESLRDTTRNVYDPPLEFQIGRGDGTLLARSNNAPPVSVLGIEGFSDILRKDGSWRVLNVVSSDGQYRVQVAYSTAMRDEAAFELALAAVIPLGIVGPLLILVIYLSIRTGLRPLERLAAQVGQRGVENLAPLERGRAPAEVMPLVEALNRLLRRLDATLENERRFTSDAAHELRTPLAAVKTQAQVALASTGAAELQHALHQVLAGAERAGRLAEQLLRIARLDPLAQLPEPRTVDLIGLARESAAGFIETSLPRSADVRFELENTPVQIEGDADLLDMAMRNLIDNAVRYTPEGTPITIVARMEDGTAVLGVKDCGAGVAADELPKIGERFYRGRGTKTEGSGLGIAIVRRIAELHGARMEISNAKDGGLTVLLRWASRGKA